MKKKFIIILSLIGIIIIALVVYFFYFKYFKEKPILIYEEETGYEESLTGIIPKQVKYYQIEYKDESCSISFLKFSNADEATRFFNEDILKKAEKLSKESPASSKSSVAISEFSGYLYRGLQWQEKSPEKSTMILQKDDLMLILTSETMAEDNIKIVIKWFIKKYTKF